jgi:hypothetical protein
MPKILLTATTDATASDEFTAADQRPGRTTLPAHFTCPEIATGEYGDVQKKSADGTWYDYYVDGTQQRVTDTNTGVTVYGPGIYRVNKEATAAATSVEVSFEGNP